MQVSVTTTQGLERRLEVAVPGERLTGDIDQRLKQLARTARIKGFRQGKVPYAVVKRQFGSQVQADAVNELLQSTFAEAVTQQRLRPVGGPRIEPIALEPGGAELRYAAIFEVLPDVTLQPLDTIAVERPTATVGDDDVEAMLETMRAQRPVFTPLERPAGEGDRVTIDYEGRIDGEVFPGGKGELLVQIGAHRILAEIEQALVGMSTGASKQGIAAKFPDDYGAQSVAGKSALFEVTVKKVEAKTLPAIDEAFAREFGIDSGSIEELRAEVRASMERELTESIRSRMREQLFDALVRQHPLELPRTMVDEQVRDLQLQALRRMGSQDAKQAPPRETVEPGARQRVALGLLLGEVIRTQGIKLDRERVERRLDNAIASYPDPAEARRAYLASREAMSQLESAALEDQAVDWMLTQVKAIDKPSSFRELTGFGRNPT